MGHLLSAAATLSGPPQGAGAQAPCMHSFRSATTLGAHMSVCTLTECMQVMQAAFRLVLDQRASDWACLMQTMTYAAGHPPERPAGLLHLRAAADESRAGPAAQWSPRSCSPLPLCQAGPCVQLKQPGALTLTCELHHSMVQAGTR